MYKSLFLKYFSIRSPAKCNYYFTVFIFDHRRERRIKLCVLIYYKILDLFVDVQLVALLEWDTAADLDLFAWDYELEELFHPTDFWYGSDFTSGYDGLEKFHFGIYESEGQEYDFTSGLYDLAVRMENSGNPETTATLTVLTVSEDLLFDDIELAHYTFRFTPDSRGDYAWIPIIELNPETLRYNRATGSDEILYLD